MTYRQCFDRLGNPVARQSRTPIGHRIIQAAGIACTLIGLVLLYGARTAS